MQDIQTLIASLRRPSLLVTAARHGADIYDRKRDLAPLLRNDALPRHGEAIFKLLDLEAEQDERRRAKAADYALRRHVGLLSAILAEARALSA